MSNLKTFVLVLEYAVPKDTLVNAMLYHVMTDPGYWKDHDKFVPERFIDSQGKFQRDERLIPFGIGENIKKIGAEMQN